MKNKVMCAVEDCERDAVQKGWCSMHYQRWVRHGDPLTLLPVRVLPQKDELEAMYEEAQSVSELARRLNISGKTLEYRMRKMGIAIRTTGYHSPHTKPHPKREAAPNWKGGRRIDSKGYVLIYMPEHGAANSRDYVFEHRLVMEAKLGRAMYPYENVHHLNGIRDDNRPENLELWERKQPPGVRSGEQQHCPTCTCFHH